MVAPGWLSRRQAEVPRGQEWLGPRERLAFQALTIEPRRASWRLGRWTAKAALSAWLDVPISRLEVLAAPDGAPEAWLDGRPAPVSISLSHREGRALAVIGDVPAVTGCDLELIEARSGPFIREWLSPTEQELVYASDEAGRPLLVNLIWTAKEAGAKVRREGLRLDVRWTRVKIARRGLADGSWRALSVEWRDGTPATGGWWRAEPPWLMSVAGAPWPAPPRPL